MLPHTDVCLKLPSGRYLCVHGCPSGRRSCPSCGGLGELVELHPDGLRIEHFCSACVGRGHVSTILGPVGSGWRREVLLPDGRVLSEQAARQEGHLQ